MTQPLPSSLPDPKAMACTLRAALAERGVALGHAHCLELVARQVGHADRNTLAAALAKTSDVRPAADTSEQALVVPEGWFVAGHSRKAWYSIGLDPDAPGVALIASRSEADIPADQPGVLMQSVAADAYLGRRVRLRAELRSENADRAAIWMRVDGRNARRSLQFDNLLQRSVNGALSGDHPWVTRDIVLDVPDEAESIHFGILLIGHGKVWARQVSMTVVGDEVTTGGPGLPPKPRNLDFGPGPRH